MLLPLDPGFIVAAGTKVDTLVQIIRDTVFIQAKAHAEPFWHSWLNPGVLVAIAGWWVNSWYSRRNQLKGFEEVVLDRIRVEVNTHLYAYEQWLNSFRPVFDLLNDREDARKRAIQARIKEHEDAKAAFARHKDFVKIIGAGKESGENRMAVPTTPDLGLRIDVSDLKNHFEKSQKPQFFRRFGEYKFLFPNFVDVFMEITKRHFEFTEYCESYFNGYQEGKVEEGHGVSIIHDLGLRMRELDSLRFEFFQFFQYECLRSLKRMSVPDFSRNSGLNYIARNPKTGELYIAPPTPIDQFEMEWPKKRRNSC